MVDGKSIDRRGLLLEPELMALGASEGQDKVPSELVVEFCRELVRNTGNWDLIELCSYIAKEKSGATSEQRLALIDVLANFKKVGVR